MANIIKPEYPLITNEQAKRTKAYVCKFALENPFLYELAGVEFRSRYVPIPKQSTRRKNTHYKRSTFFDMQE